MKKTIGRQRKYFIINTEEDFRRGCGAGIRIGKNGLMPCREGTAGVYYTRIFDSGEFGTEWHRLTLFGELEYGTGWTVTVYAADSLGLKGKEETAEEFRQAFFDGHCDSLLFGVRGRYLWLKIEFYAKGTGMPCITRIRIDYPKHTWLSYLPEIYEEDPKSASFLERYLGIFQSLYEDMTERIEKIPGMLEPSVSEEHMLCELADWLGIEGKELWDRRQLLYLVRHAGTMNARRGTVAGLRELVRLYTGSNPYIVEYHQIRRYFDGDKRERLLRALYVAHCREFAVILNWKNGGDGRRTMGLKQVIDMAKPVHMESRIVVLKPYIFLDQHSYIGINSILGQYRPLQLDGLCTVPFSVIASEKGGQTT